MIEDLLAEIGIEDIRPLGDEIQGRCPMHERRTGAPEHRPDNWSINRHTGAHQCWSCQYSGSLTRLIQDVAGMGLWDAHRLIRHHGVDLQRIEDEAWEPPVALSLETQFARFGLPPIRACQRRKITPRQLSKYRLRWDAEEQGWVIPIMSPTGDMWGWQTKTTDEIRNHPPGIKKARTLFGFDVLRSTRAVLVESSLDVAYLDSLYVPAVAAFGCNVSNLQMRLLLGRCDSLVLALDNDKAGIEATRRILQEKWHHRLPITVFNYHGMLGKDPGELSPEEITRGLDTAPLASFW
jgi:DNA primase